MFIYSKKIIEFISEITAAAKKIISTEIGLKTHGDRFYNRNHTASYPLKVVIYNNKSMLGYFDSSFYELGFHESLMRASNFQLYNIIRHELAHYITFIDYGNTASPHGPEFRAFCRQMNWGEEVYKAAICLEEQNIVPEKENAVFRKVQKLMALATSQNEHEASQAMIKSRQLLLKHHMESKYVGTEEEEIVSLKRIMKQKKETTKMRAIAKILETFFVNIVYFRAGGFLYLEILGNSTNLEIAEYVAETLDRELDSLWTQAQNQSNLKGAVAKNSFFLGIAKGYCNKVQALKREYTRDTTQALMVIEKKLAQAKSMIYKRLSSTKSTSSHCQESSLLGEQMGKKLNIHPGIQKSSNDCLLLDLF